MGLNAEKSGDVGPTEKKVQMKVRMMTSEIGRASCRERVYVLV